MPKCIRNYLVLPAYGKLSISYIMHHFTMRIDMSSRGLNVFYRGKFVDVYDTHMTICLVGNAATVKDYETFIHIDKRADIRLRFIKVLSKQFKDTDLAFSLSK